MLLLRIRLLLYVDQVSYLDNILPWPQTIKKSYQVGASHVSVRDATGSHRIRTAQKSKIGMNTYSKKRFYFLENKARVPIEQRRSNYRGTT